MARKKISQANRNNENDKAFSHKDAANDLRGILQTPEAHTNGTVPKTLDVQSAIPAITQAFMESRTSNRVSASPSPAVIDGNRANIVVNKKMWIM